jgi:flagellar biosynthetic protein FliR
MNFLEGRMLGAFLILTRLGAFWAVCPVFSWPALTPEVKVASAVTLSLFLAGTTPFAATAQSPDILQIIIWTGSEAVYGLGLGLVVYALFAVIRNSAGIAEQQIGLTTSSVLDPTTEEQEGVITVLMELFLILLLFATDGHHILLKVLSRSYGRYGIGQIPAIGDLTQSVIMSGSAMLMLALQMSAPILAAFLLLMIVMAIMARIAPESNILFLSLPVRVGLGLITLGILAPFLGDYLKHFVVWVDKLIVV